MIGIVADDITGANDIGIMYAKAGWVADVFPHTYFYEHEKSAVSNPDVLILDTNSRLDDEKTAYEKVYKSTQSLERRNCTQFFNKTCSVFRGNIGAEFDAMLDALDESFAVVVLGFPKNGRTTIHQEHYVHGKKLSESNFCLDPVHPTYQSNLVDILQGQTKRKVDHLDIDVIRQGSQALKAKINSMRQQCNYLILDVENQESLRVIAEAIIDEKIIAGASGISEELAQIGYRKPSTNEMELEPEPLASAGILCAAGSLTPQTKAQVNHLKFLGFPTLELTTARIFSEHGDEYLQELAETVTKDISEGKDILIHTTNDPEEVSKTKELGKRQGYSNKEISRMVSESIATVVAKVANEIDVKRFLLAGGESSAAICDRLGINGLRVYKEIEPGLPSCVSLTPPHSIFVLKSGSFGGEDFFVKAIEHLKQHP